MPRKRSSRPIPMNAMAQNAQMNSENNANMKVGVDTMNLEGKIQQYNPYNMEGN